MSTSNSVFMGKTVVNRMWIKRDITIKEAFNRKKGKDLDNLASDFKMRHGNNWGTGVLLIGDNGKILVGLRADGDKEWCTPGGRVRLNETPYDAIIRETKEECGLDIIPEFIGTEVEASRKTVWVSFQFIARNVGGVPVPQPSEILEWRWVDWEEFINMTPMFPPTKNMIKRLLQQSGSYQTIEL